MSDAALKALLRERLLPVEAWSVEDQAARSDFDLNPDAVREVRTLRAAAVLIPIIAHEGIAHEDGATVLMTRRADTLASHTGQIAFPGGRLDPGETAVQAALREAWEEVALDPEAVEVLGLGDAYETGTGFLVTPVIGWLTRAPSTRPSPDEVAEVFEVPWDFLIDGANHRRDYYDPETGPRRWYWAVPYNERYIWGVTAGIVRALRGRLYGEGADAEVGGPLAEEESPR